MDFGFQDRSDDYPSRRLPTPQWIERREPVIYSDWTQRAPLARRQHDAFCHDGFLVVENLFQPSEIKALESELSRLRQAPSSLQGETVIAERGSDDVRSIFAIHRQSMMFKNLARDQRLLDIASYILDDDVYVHQSRLNYKRGFAGKEFYWHSDFETWHVEDGMPAMRAVSVS
ncbi:MAG TPA: phytanoyl-CoA dioxygenase family protein, partial [Hyphomonadaceae bacterium]|nr:phytanoyl-CoA dioxygenase family protein [Hyphomonadaceae bacterium]